MGGKATSKRRQRQLGSCAYCGNPATTKDHIPPKGMFSKQTPDKPWVPSCHPCNKEASKDDEYMQRLSMLWGADRSRDAIEVGDKFIRSLGYPEAKGLQAEVRRSLSPLEDESLFPGGINVALRGDQLGRVVDKLVRGWMFKLIEKRLPEGYGIPKHLVGQTDHALYSANETIMETWPETVFGDRAFTLRCAFGGHDPLLSCWRFEFYGVFKIMAYSVREAEDTFQILDLRSPDQTDAPLR